MGAFPVAVLLAIGALLPFAANAAVLSAVPASQTAYQGDTFLVELRIDTEGKTVNTAAGTLRFPPALLEAIDISTGGSAIRLWPEGPSFSNTAGTVRFTGGIPGGFQGEGKLLRVLFQTRAPGTASIDMEELAVLLHDGKGTQVDASFTGGTYDIGGPAEGLPRIASPTHPDPNAWHPGTTLRLSWDEAPGAQYSFILSQDLPQEPDFLANESTEGPGKASYQGLEDGIYYFSLREKLPEEGWSDAVHFRAMVDAVPPEPFEVELSQHPEAFEGSFFVSFAAADSTSGIDRYEVRRISQAQEEDGWQRAESPHVLAAHALGGTMAVRAVDKAGNAREVVFELPPGPSESSLPFIVLLIALVSSAALLRFSLIRMRQRKAMLTNHPQQDEA